MSIRVLAISLSSLVLMLLLKSLFGRKRPLSPLLKTAKGLSFPSGHALASFCFYGVLAGLIVDRVERLSVRVAVGVLAAVLVLAIGISRIYLGVHYPSDVVAGYIAAAMWVGTMLVIDHVGTRAVKHVRRRRKRS